MSSISIMTIIQILPFWGEDLTNANQLNVEIREQTYLLY